MATNEAELCNIALARVGQRQFIDALDEDTTEAESCSVLYGPTRDSVLAEFPWRFATRRATLAVLASVTRSEWQYAYSLPEDFISAQSLYAGKRNPAADERPAYAIEMNDAGNGLILVTDTEDAELKYTARVETVSLFPPLFVDAVAWKLAAELCLALPIKPQVGLRMSEGYGLAIAKAAARDAQQAQEDQPPDSEFIRLR